MEKKNYVELNPKVIKLQHQTYLLAGSEATQSDTGGDSPAPLFTRFQ